MNKFRDEALENHDDKYSKAARKAIAVAMEIAENIGQGYVGTEHLLIALMETEGAAKKVLEENGVTIEKLLDSSRKLSLFDTVEESDGNDAFSPAARRVLLGSEGDAVYYGYKQVGTEHILIGLLKESGCMASRILKDLDVNIAKVFSEVILVMGGDANAARMEYAAAFGNNDNMPKNMMTEQFSRDITRLAKDGKLDPCIGRETEIQRLIQILCRKTKNNPCLVGEPGVGKTAVLEGLASRIASGKVPEMMKNKRILSLDISGMVAGTKYRGEFEERIKQVINEVCGEPDIILFVDELHTIIGAGGAEGSMDAANILKPALARGELRMIGATTLEEYRKHIEKDAALERRFQRVVIEEPSVEETIEILRGLKPSYEKHHDIKISDEALIACAKLTSRYVNDRFLPDKAIDAMDEAAARLHLDIDTGSTETESLKAELKKVQKDLEKALISNKMKEASQLADREAELSSLLKNTKKETKKKSKKTAELKAENIERVISQWTKIPLEKVQASEGERLLKLSEILELRVKGQNDAVDAVSKAIRRGRVGLKDPNRPIGSFLFLGPTGVGKTELSKALAEAMFGDENAMIRVDMSEYMEKHSVSKFIGSPPGYVGHEEGGQLSEQIRRKPYSVLLFDELEKAHPDVFNILLQVLEDGHITDSNGRKVSFKNCIIIMTSNAGAQAIMNPKHLGFVGGDDANANYERMKEGVMEQIKNIFKPEFLNRIDETIVFRPLDNDTFKEIARMQLEILKKRCLEQMGAEFIYDESVCEYILQKGIDKKFGARPIRRAVQTRVEDRVAEEFLKNPGLKKIEVTTEKGELKFIV
ncbi:MAG: ATP-dependent Clp protease ATP-binding subunit [Lachnospiraceae bacterium]|nr:ATP-dependent Clp protease ATP-binding subunit [Lachnospiraceae bacterium]